MTYDALFWVLFKQVLRTLDNAFVTLPQEEQLAIIRRVDEAVENILSWAQPGGGSQPQVVGTVTWVDVGNGPQRGLVLGAATPEGEGNGPFPDGAGLVTCYQGGVDMNRVDAGDFTVPLDAAGQMFGGREADQLVGSGESLALQKLVSDLLIAAGARVTLVPVEQAQTP